MDVKKVESTEVSQQWPAACKEWGRVKSRGGVFRRLAQADSGWSCNSPNSTCPRQNMLSFPCKTWESSTYLYWLGGLHLRALGRWEENWGKVDTITFTFHISKRKCNSVFFSFFFLSLYESIFPSVPHSFLPNWWLWCLISPAQSPLATSGGVHYSTFCFCQGRPTLTI